MKYIACINTPIRYCRSRKNTEPTDTIKLSPKLKIAKSKNATGNPSSGRVSLAPIAKAITKRQRVLNRLSISKLINDDATNICFGRYIFLNKLSLAINTPADWFIAPEKNDQGIIAAKRKIAYWSI